MSERACRIQGRAGFDATKLYVAALDKDWQGKRLRSGERASDVLMNALLIDVRNRVPKRDARIFALVHEDNLRSIALCKRHGLTQEMSRQSPQYRSLITP
jgi:hypothetical protein